jgi:hypothetical protein
MRKRLEMTVLKDRLVLLPVAGYRFPVAGYRFPVAGAGFSTKDADKRKTEFRSKKNILDPANGCYLIVHSSWFIAHSS